MKREIKFRIWHKRLKRMIYPDSDGTISLGNSMSLIYLGLNGRVYETAKGWEEDLTDQIELLEYTGLKDKNGKEIYEGDIVLWNKNSWKVFWSDELSGWCKQLLDQKTYYSPFLNHLDMEVIGNIHINQNFIKVI